MKVKIVKALISEGYPYLEAQDDKGEYLDDSQKIWFPIDIDPDNWSWEDISNQVAEHFPEAEFRIISNQ